MGYNALDGAHVTKFEGLQAHFSYPQVRELIYREKHIATIVKSKEVGDMLNIIKGVKNIEELLDDFTVGTPTRVGDIFNASDAHRTVVLDKLVEYLKKNYYFEDSTKIRNSVSRITSDGTRHLNPAQAYEVLLFSSLFAYVQKKPDEDDEAYLENLLKQQSQDLMLDLMQNKTQNTIVIPAADSPLQRHLAPGEQILALTISGKVITFLPRICALESLVMYRKSSKLVAQDRNKKEVMSLDDPNVHIFSRSDDYGLLAADEQGNFIQEYCAAEGPDGEILWLRGDQDDYGFLLSDGSYQGRRPKKGWNNLLSFDLCNGGAIAVSNDRKAIDENGKVLGEHIAAVSCCAQRWILLRLDGSVVTDQGDLPITEGTGRAVCADAEGYWVSTDDKLLRIEDNTIVEEFDEPMDEIWQDNFGTTVCGLGTDGSIQFLC